MESGKWVFLQRKSEDPSARRLPGVARREHAHDVQRQAVGATRHSRSRFQWIWNLRLELGQQFSPAERRTTEFAPAQEAESPSTEETEQPAAPPFPVTYGPPQWARPSFTHGFPGSAFPPQPDGTLCCPANHPLYLQERRASTR